MRYINLTLTYLLTYSADTGKLSAQRTRTVVGTGAFAVSAAVTLSSVTVYQQS